MLTHPTVHLNGTSRDELLRQHVEAHIALRVALDKMGEASPHARDYYVSNDSGAFTKARLQHQARCEAIAKVMAELQEIAETLAE